MIRPYDGADYGRISFPPTMGADYGRISFPPTMERITGGMVLKILPPVVQNGLKIPHEGAFLAQGRINAPPHQQRAASIGVGIVNNYNNVQFCIFHFSLTRGM